MGSYMVGAMDVRKLSRAEGLAIIGGLLLAIGLFLHWYHAKTVNTTIAGHTGPVTLSGWSVHTLLRWVLLAGAAAPLILTYIVARGHALSWPRGEVTAIVAIFAFGLIAYNGLLAKPGIPRAEVSLQIGYFVAIAGTGLMLIGAASRTSEAGGRARRPPGTL
ncbi:MAG: hypothetical protein NVSMB51_05420 [Solirubrobacteraceae bacterium]